MQRMLYMLGFIAVLVAPNAMAQSSERMFIGGGGGILKHHGPNTDTGITGFGRLGKRIEGNVSWEADASLTLSDGKRGQQDWSVTSLAGYAVYRTNTPIQVKAKLGVALWDDDFDDDLSLAAGIGLGFRLGAGTLDVEFTQINDHTDFVTVGFTVPF
ncbi:MAG: outer membrane beta-barrel protein [Burkholderiales bacterium]